MTGAQIFLLWMILGAYSSLRLIEVAGPMPIELHNMTRGKKLFITALLMIFMPAILSIAILHKLIISK